MAPESEWKTVSETSPCEACNKPDWCRRSSDGGGWGEYGWGMPSAGYNAGAAARDTNNINLAAQQNLSAQGAYLAAMGRIDSITPLVRRKMTEKYRIEF